MKVFLKYGDDANTAKNVKGRRRLSAAIDDKPAVVNQKYEIDESKGKLNVVIVPEKGTRPGETELEFEYRVEGDKIPPPPPPVPEKPKPVEEKPAAEKAEAESSGTNVILIAACGVLLVLVLVCCFLYVQYRNKLNKQK